MAKITIDTEKDSPETIQNVITMLQAAIQGNAMQSAPVSQPTPAPASSSSSGYQDLFGSSSTTLPSSEPVKSANPFDTSLDAQKSGGIFDVFGSSDSSLTSSTQEAVNAPSTSIFDSDPAPAPSRSSESATSQDDVFSMFNSDSGSSLPSTDATRFGTGRAQDLIRDSVGFDIPDYDQTKDSFSPREDGEAKKSDFFGVETYDD